MVEEKNVKIILVSSRIKNYMKEKYLHFPFEFVDKSKISKKISKLDISIIILPTLSKSCERCMYDQTY